jgi:phosphoglycerol transferase MdoB-like AlkP superfamily enzyme
MDWRSRLILAIATILLPCASLEASAGLEIIKHDVPAVLESGSVATVPIIVANGGSLPWSPAGGFALSYHWLDAARETVVWDGRRTPLPETVIPGASIALVATVEAPVGAGNYWLLWDVVQEGVLWVSETGAEEPEPIPVSVSPGHSFRMSEGSAPRIMTAGSESVVELVLHNDGDRTWRADGTFAVAYHWLGRDGGGVRAQGQSVYWEGRRTPFPVAVRGGETVELEAVVVAPDRSGLWRLQWDLVEEGVCWFSDRAPEPLPTLRVLVAPDPLASGFWWSLLVLMAGAAAVSVWRSGGPRVLVPLFSIGDVVWCVGALSVKQGLVLMESAARPTPVGWLMIAAGASLLALLTRLLPERIRGWACWGIVAAGTFVLWADSIYLRFFGDLPATAAIAGAGQLGRVGASVRELLAPGDVWMWLDLLPGLVLVLTAERLRRDSVWRPSRVVVAGLLTMITAGGLAAAYLALTPPNLLAQVFRRVTVAEDVGVLNLHAVDGARSVARRVISRELGPTQVNEIAEWFRERAPQRAGTGSLFAAAEGKNLIMVQVESLQNFVIGLEIGGREVTPFLNRWTEEALWFSNMTDQTGQGRSSDSELTTQVSLLPMVGGAAAFRFAANDFTGLAEALAERGYHTLSAVPYEGAFWNRRRTHRAYGFGRSLFVEDFEVGQNIGWGLSDRDFLSQAVSELAVARKPFAAYLLTLSLHHPFDGFPAHLEELDVGIWNGTPFGNFLHTMHFFDTSLAAFVADLERYGLADNTVVAIWGDHDAGFPWRPDVASAMGATHDAAGWYLSQEVPLLIKVPGVDLLRGERAVPAGHTDIAPTLLALLGVDPASYAFVGRNLLGNHGDRPVVGEYGCWRDSTHLFLQGNGPLDDGTCIELATMAPVSRGKCREGYGEAMRTEEVSALVLEHDLQRAIHHELVGGPGPVR